MAPNFPSDREFHCTGGWLSLYATWAGSFDRCPFCGALVLTWRQSWRLPCGMLACAGCAPCVASLGACASLAWASSPQCDGTCEFAAVSTARLLMHAAKDGHTRSHRSASWASAGEVGLACLMEKVLVTLSSPFFPSACAADF